MKNYLLLLTLLCLSLSARAHDAEVDGIFYNLDAANKTATVTFQGDYSGSYDNEYSGDVVIPETVTYGDITYSVTSLGRFCFAECSSLTSITIPNSVTSLGDDCFWECSRLTSVTIPNSVTSLGESCFHDCSRLTSITIPNSVTSLGDYCFMGCSRLTSITIPNSVTSLGKSCFSSCGSLTAITIPNSVTSLGDWCFSSCGSLTAITIPNSVTSLGDWCFSYCSSLTSITIPNSVTSLGQECFSDCYSLTSITMLPSTPPSTGSNIFAYTSLLETVYVVDEDAKTAYQAQEPWGNYEIVVMPLPDVQLSVGATGYATLYYSNYDLVVPKNTVAYTYRSENGALTESEIYAEGTVIPAGEAVVVYTTNDVPCTLNFKQGIATVDCDANSQLAGTDEETAITPDADYYFYGLSLNSSNDINSVGFYWMVADGAAFTNGAHKAYLKIRKSEFAGTQPAKAFAFKGTATGVESVESSNNAPQAIYDLTGRRVSKVEKGIYIINGKKVIK